MAKKKWIQAAKMKKGALRGMAKRRGKIKGDEPLSQSDVMALMRAEPENTLLQKRGQAALNMMRLHGGGNRKAGGRRERYQRVMKRGGR